MGLGDRGELVLGAERGGHQGVVCSPWALPGTAGLEHRIGGLEKADGTGNIGAACRRVRTLGMHVAHIHLRHLNPLPRNLGEVLAHYDKVVMPEMNLGQLALLLRARYLTEAHSHTKVSGLPFKAEELQNLVIDFCAEVHTPVEERTPA